MKDVGEIRGAIKIENGIMVLTLGEQERMKLIRRLAVSGKAYVDDKGNMDIHFDIGRRTPKGSEEEVEVTNRSSEMKANPSYLELVEDEEKVEVEYDKILDTDIEDSRRSIDDLTSEEKEFLVDLYINDIPTTIIMESENVTKSALYSSLERERIPRKGKLNTVIRRIEDGDTILDISLEEKVDISVLNRIIDTLSEGGVRDEY